MNSLCESVSRSLEKTKMWELKLGRQKQVCVPSVASGFGVSLGCLGCCRACPWSPASGEVTPGCVETTLAKCHGNERGCHPHRAPRLRERVPGDENVDLGRERGSQSQEPGRGKARGRGLSSGRSVSLLCEPPLYTDSCPLARD